MPEVCPSTGKECSVLEIVNAFSGSEIQVIPKGNFRLASLLFRERYQELIQNAQNGFCSEEQCGLEAVAVAYAIRHAALEDVKTEFNS